MNKKKRLLGLLLFVVLGSAVFLSGCGKQEKATPPEDSQQQEETEDSRDDTDVNEDQDVDDDTEDEDMGSQDTEVDFSDFSEDSQELGTSQDKEDSDYTLVAINDEEMNGYHRIEFVLESDDEDNLPKITSRLVSGGGYIQVVLDRVTEDNSGIGYQDARELDEKGVLRIYHDVSSNQSEEVYNIGIAEDTEFYLYEGEGLSVVLDVAYPGSEETSEEEDEGVEEDTGEFSTSDQTISNTNNSGTARIGTYTWANTAEALKFVWNTSASSGNPIPETQAEYDESNNEITVAFKGVEKDFIADGFENSLTGPVSTVTGQRSGTTSTYTFKLTKDTEYRIYKNLSPNQVVIEIKR
jgi:hypothetical protein